MNLIKVRVPVYGRPEAAAQDGSRRELVAGNAYGLRARASGFLALIRPIFFILTPLNAASAAVLARGGYPPLTYCLLGFIAVALASGTVNVGNDYIDRQRDKLIWPARPIPSGRVKPREAMFLAAGALVISLTITWLAFNPMTFFILLLAVMLGALYSAYLRDRAGYLALPPIVGMIYLGGWAALAPETLFSSWLPWYLYLLGVVWQTAHIMVYYPLHVTAPGAEPETKVPPALFFTPSPPTAVRIGAIFAGLTLLLSLLLPLLAPLSPLYLVPVTAAGGYALFHVFRLRKDARNRERGLRAFTSLSVFRLVISASILLTIFLPSI